MIFLGWSPCEKCLFRGCDDQTHSWREVRMEKSLTNLSLFGTSYPCRICFIYPVQRTLDKILTGKTTAWCDPHVFWASGGGGRQLVINQFVCLAFTLMLVKKENKQSGIVKSWREFVKYNSGSWRKGSNLHRLEYQSSEVGVTQNFKPNWLFLLINHPIRRACRWPAWYNGKYR